MKKIRFLRLMPCIIRLLKYSFEEIEFNFESLTRTERKLVTRKEMKKIKELCN